jgi:hypothetical protein
VYDLSVPRPPAIDPDPAQAPARPSAGTLLRLGFLTVLAAVLYCLGRVAGSICVPIGVAARWMYAAMATGWDDASTSWHRTGRK